MDKVTKEQALRLIGDGEAIHTFREAAFCIVGCDWKRKEMIEAFDKYEDTFQLAGENAKIFKHGLALEDESGYVFIETLEDVLAEVEKEIECPSS